MVNFLFDFHFVQSFVAIQDVSSIHVEEASYASLDQHAYQGLFGLGWNWQNPACDRYAAINDD